MVKSRKKKIYKNRKKSLKNQINKYIFKKQDICCEEDFKREDIIKQIFYLYKKKDGDEEYLDWIDNDLTIFIGYYADLANKKDKKGAKLFKKMEKATHASNAKQHLRNIKKLMADLPLYYLLSFLGGAYYKYKINKMGVITKP